MTPPLLLATLFTSQVLVNGAVTGLVYGLVGMGLVLVYRSTRVINFAVGSMGLPAAGVMALLTLQYGFPYWVALPLALVAGTGFATAMELIVVRRLFTAPRVIVLVATIGIAQLALAVTMSLPDVDDANALFPLAFASRVHLGGVELTGAQVCIAVVVPVIAFVLGWLMTRTAFGRGVAAAADNADLARLSGVSPRTASTIVWTIAGAVSSISLVLIAGASGGVNQVATLGPATLTRGLVVAVLAGMKSFPRALAAGLAVGVVEAVVGFNNVTDPGRFESYLFILVLVVVFFQARRADRSVEDASPASYSFTPKVKPIPAAIRDRWWVRHHGRLLFAVALVVAIVAPLIITQPTRAYLYASIGCFALVALSVSIVTGWAGQLSLGQMAFAGGAALGAGTLVRGITFTIGGLDFEVQAMPLIPALIIVTVLTALAAVVIGLGALRIRGLLLGVTTFVFAYAAQQDLFGYFVFSGGMQPPIRVPRGEVFGLDLASQRTYYWFVLACVALTITIVARLRRRAPGRNQIAVRDNPASASAYTLSPTRTKLIGFALSGAVAGLGGALLGVLTQNINTNQLFIVQDSLDVVAIAVIGGLGSISGPILGALWVKGLPAFFPGNDLVPLFASSIGLLVLLLYFPGGLVQIGYWIRDGFFAWLAKRVAVPEARRPAAVPSRRRGDGAGDGAGSGADAAAPAVVAQEVVVTFGGVRAVDAASLRVARGEVVGLIGTNGAGKSTLLNAVGGYLPAKGRIEVLGRDMSGTAADRRARLGLGRTFQAARLFSELTVRETIMVALEGRHHSSFTAAALAWPTSGREERRKAAEATEIIDFLGLGGFAENTIAELSTGTRRIVELAALVALDAKVLCLDEPTAGVAQRESEAFGPLLLAIRDELDASLLVVEHDMPMIMSLSDRVYCLEAGHVIAEGPPEAVRNDPLVVASYLGTDPRAIERSDSRRSADGDTTAATVP